MDGSNLQISPRFLLRPTTNESFSDSRKRRGKRKKGSIQIPRGNRVKTVEGKRRSRRRIISIARFPEKGRRKFWVMDIFFFSIPIPPFLGGRRRDQTVAWSLPFLGGWEWVLRYVFYPGRELGEKAQGARHSPFHDTFLGEFCTFSNISPVSPCHPPLPLFLPG